MKIVGSWGFIGLEIMLLVLADVAWAWKTENIDFDVSIWTLFMDNTIIIATVVLTKIQNHWADAILNLTEVEAHANWSIFEAQARNERQQEKILAKLSAIQKQHKPKKHHPARKRKA